MILLPAWVLAAASLAALPLPPAAAAPTSAGAIAPASSAASAPSAPALPSAASLAPGDAAAGSGAARRLTLEEAIGLALKRSPDLGIADAEISAASAGRKAALAALGPRLRLEGSVVVWDKPLDISFLEIPDDISSLDPSLLPAPTTIYEFAFLQLATALSEMFGDLDKPMRVRDRVTGSVSVSIVQPLTPLYAMFSVYRMKDCALAASRLGRRSSELNKALQVVQGYFGLLKTMRLSEIGASAVSRLEAHAKRAAAFHRAGLIGRNEVLKAELALASAKGGLVTARSGVAFARSALAVAIGLGAEEVIAPADLAPSAVAPVAFSIEEAERRALAARPELAAMRKRIDMARAGKHAAIGAMLPTIAVMGNFTHTEGSTFSDKDAFFFGASLSWDAWDWGAKFFGLREAEAMERSAAAGLTKISAGIRLLVRKAYVDLRAAEEQLSIAEVAVEQAKENFRTENARFEANVNTSTDVIDASMALSMAEGSLATAYYDYLLARHALEIASGRIPAGVKP